MTCKRGKKAWEVLNRPWGTTQQARDKARYHLKEHGCQPPRRRIIKPPPTPPKTKFTSNEFGETVPSGSNEPPAKWPCDFCKSEHYVKDPEGRPFAFCRAIGGRVYSAEALKKPKPPKRDWTAEHTFEEDTAGELRCSHCGKSYLELEHEELRRLAE